MTLVAKLLTMLEDGRDSALLRYSLGTEYLRAGEARPAITHLEEAVRQDPEYSAAWKSLGKAYAAAGETAPAAASWRQGIDVARSRGDEQAAREMTVFLRRLRKTHGPD